MAHRPEVDWTLYLVADPAICGGRALECVVEQAVRGGVTVVQLRDKECATGEYVEHGRRLLGLLGPLGVPLIINDRPDVALAVGAEGVHLGQSDMPIDAARRLLGENALIGLTVDAAGQALAEAAALSDYLGVGPIFPTSTKADTAPEWGCEGLESLRRRTRNVLVAIGGVNASNAADVICAGADGIAVVSAICSAPDPRLAAEELRRTIECGRRASDSL
ncbi:MAG: thiamine phosphate synthase [Candidatus Brocadiia bacterium]|nr:thiamine phosphate synthase [Candidatus Brocadiia bacterium]